MKALAHRRNVVHLSHRYSRIKVYVAKLTLDSLQIILIFTLDLLQEMLVFTLVL